MRPAVSAARVLGRLIVSLFRIAVGVVLGLAAVLAGMGVTGGVERRFFYPDRRNYGSPATLGLPYRDIEFRSADGTRLHGWFVPARGARRGTVLHAHGNAQNLTAHFAFVDWLPARGYDVFAFDYRGYGRSEGRPTLRGALEDTRAALATVRALPEADANRLFVLGQSLGGALALAALGREPTPPVRAVVVDSAFSSPRAIVRDVIGGLPGLQFFAGPLSRWLVSDEVSAEAVVGRLSPVPLLFIHGEADRVIPVGHSDRLFAAAREPKMYWRIPGLDHTEALTLREWQDRLVAFFESAAAD
ncbi:MAG: alpha/beta hydrolase [Kiritimatiellae bacterium]|nr:alpha/beta hydrolase [Kiritimatiellia bacterium]